MFDEGTPVRFETPFAIACVALGLPTKLDALATASVKEPDIVKSARHTQVAPSDIKNSQVELVF